MFWKISGWISIFLVSAKFTILIIFIYFIATGWLSNTYCYRVFQFDFKIETRFILLLNYFNSIFAFLKMFNIYYGSR